MTSLIYLGLGYKHVRRGMVHMCAVYKLARALLVRHRLVQVNGSRDSDCYEIGTRAIMALDR